MVLRLLLLLAMLMIQTVSAQPRPAITYCMDKMMVAAEDIRTSMSPFDQSKSAVRKKLCPVVKDLLTCMVNGTFSSRPSVQELSDMERDILRQSRQMFGIDCSSFVNLTQIADDLWRPSEKVAESSSSSEPRSAKRYCFDKMMVALEGLMASTSMSRSHQSLASVKKKLCPVVKDYSACMVNGTFSSRPSVQELSDIRPEILRIPRQTFGLVDCSSSVNLTQIADDLWRPTEKVAESSSSTEPRPAQTYCMDKMRVAVDDLMASTSLSLYDQSYIAVKMKLCPVVKDFSTCLVNATFSSRPSVQELSDMRRDILRILSQMFGIDCSSSVNLTQIADDLWRPSEKVAESSSSTVPRSAQVYCMDKMMVAVDGIMASTSMSPHNQSYFAVKMKLCPVVKDYSTCLVNATFSSRPSVQELSDMRRDVLRIPRQMFGLIDCSSSVNLTQIADDLWRPSEKVAESSSSTKPGPAKTDCMEKMMVAVEDIMASMSPFDRSKSAVKKKLCPVVKDYSTCIVKWTFSSRPSVQELSDMRRDMLRILSEMFRIDCSRSVNLTQIADDLWRPSEKVAESISSTEPGPAQAYCGDKMMVAVEDIMARMSPFDRSKSAVKNKLCPLVKDYSTCMVNGTFSSRPSVQELSAMRRDVLRIPSQMFGIDCSSSVNLTQIADDLWRPTEKVVGSSSSTETLSRSVFHQRHVSRRQHHAGPSQHVRQQLVPMGPFGLLRVASPPKSRSYYEDVSPPHSTQAATGPSPTVATHHVTDTAPRTSSGAEEPVDGHQVEPQEYTPPFLHPVVFNPFLKWVASSTRLNEAQLKLSVENTRVAKLMRAKLKLEIRQLKKSETKN